ncbi:RrF2 family transcriptional regulator [Saccharopolyspora sp. 5N708]|uniref:RrF2 family transcriptional regulator n=1 Tax=Saccharopolyspora sp. 5N708 TaxID=3457424 RepID=UPI003FD49231
MSEGVEWGLHSCVLLGWLSPEAVAGRRLAEYHELPPAYLNKQLQALVRAGIVTSVSGPKGGFQLARRPDRITLLDVVVAIEGTEKAFRCTEIRQQGRNVLSPEHYRQPCSIAVAMRKAELAWRRELAAQTVAEMMASVQRHSPDTPERVRRWFDTERS